MRLSQVFKESKKHITTLLFVGGFIFDLLILPEAGHIATILIGLLYLGIVAFSIAMREWVVSKNTASKSEQKIFSLLTFAIAYFSGSALSFICVYALRSAELSVSWPLLVILGLCVLANEIVSSHLFRFTLDVAVLLIATLFFIIFNMPSVLNVQNDITFLISTLVAVVMSLLYLYVLQFTSESAREEAPKLYALAVGIPMFIGMLYFLNVIPAVPLSLANGGVYHAVTRDVSGVFLGQREVDTRMFSSLKTPVFHISSQDPRVYFFSAVAAPAKLTAPISHVWELYNTETSTWEEKTVISFTLDGGRESGYRAYSQKDNVSEGLWRVSVKVDSKRIVGRVKFYVIKSDISPVLKTMTL
jgi:hypothetical protein